MSYEMFIGTKHRGCVVILVDQSTSMNERFGGASGGTKEKETARAVNRAIQDLVLLCRAGDAIKDRLDIGVIGYGSSVGSCLGGALSGAGLVSVADIAHAPLRVETVKRKVADGAGGLVEIDFPTPVWVEPQAGGGTPMHRAFEMASELVRDWCKANSASFPPVIVNVTDGEPDSETSAKTAAQTLTSLGTSDGKALLFSAHISSTNATPIVTPSSAAGLPNDHARFLFELASEIPAPLLPAAAEEGLSSAKGARGFVYNADVENMIRLLRFGTAGTMTRMTDER